MSAVLLKAIPSGVLGYALKGAEVELRVERLTEGAVKGRVSQAWQPTGAVLRGVLSAPKADTAEHLAQQQYRVTHQLSVRGRADVRPDDVLAFGTRRFAVLEAIDPSALGSWTRILLEEREGLP